MYFQLSFNDYSESKENSNVLQLDHFTDNMGVYVDGKQGNEIDNEREAHTKERTLYYIESLHWEIFSRIHWVQ